MAGLFTVDHAYEQAVHAYIYDMLCMCTLPWPPQPSSQGEPSLRRLSEMSRHASSPCTSSSAHPRLTTLGL